MFEDLEERMKEDDTDAITRRERIAKRLVIAVLSVFLFGGLYFLVQAVE